MKTTLGLAAAAAVLAAVGAAYTQPAPDRPALPPIVLDPGVRLPAPAPADMVPPPALPAVPPAKVELPPLPVVAPAPLPVPMPIVPAAKAEPTKLPAVPPPVLPLPAVPAPVAQPAPLPPPAALPKVPPPVTQPAPLPPPAALPKVPPPVAQPLPPPLAVTPTMPPTNGGVVVLQDGKIVEGHVSRAEGKVIVRRASVDQKFTTEQVKYVAGSKDEAYRLTLKDTKADDPAARLRLARWCMYNGMRENALTEAKEAVRLEPANRTAATLVRTLEESLKLYPGDGTTRVTTPAPTPAPTLPAPAPTLPAVPPPPVTTVPEPDVAPEAAVAFGPRVQPVLMNQCASCHASATHTSAFKLTAVPSNEVNAAATRANLRAAAAQVKKTEPAASPLLLKAVTAHGGQLMPAFGDREAAAFRILQAWAFLSVGELAPPVAAAPPAAAPVLPPAPVADVRPTLPLPPTVPASVPTVPAPPAIPPAEGSIPPIPPASDNPGFGRTAPPPIPVVPAKDEFDPDNFNRR
ncbi:MAG: hypothetical protein U0804_09825 [Gemmataceae bacterium]